MRCQAAALRGDVHLSAPKGPAAFATHATVRGGHARQSQAQTGPSAHRVPPCRAAHHPKAPEHVGPSGAVVRNDTEGGRSGYAAPSPVPRGGALRHHRKVCTGPAVPAVSLGHPGARAVVSVHAHHPRMPGTRVRDLYWDLLLVGRRVRRTAPHAATNPR